MMTAASRDCAMVIRATSTLYHSISKCVEQSLVRASGKPGLPLRASSLVLLPSSLSLL